MATGRPSAKQAIEVLKIHQLRRENAVIFGEVKALREDVTIRQNDLDEARKDVSKLTDEVKKMQRVVCDYETRLAQLDTGSGSHAEELKGLQHGHRSLREEFSAANTAFDVINLQNQTNTKQLAEEITLIKNQIVVCEQNCANFVEELRNDLASRAEKGAVAELEDKLEDFIQEIDVRFEALQKVSYVSDSFASPRNQQFDKCDRVHNASSPTATIPSHFMYEDNSDRGRWEPIDTQAALRATPPAMPETLILPQPREETDMQTPSTLRSTVPARGAISNMVRTQPMVEQTPAVPQHAGLPVPPEVARQQVSAAEFVQQRVEVGWEALNRILKLRQCETEPLAQYFAKFQSIATRFPSDCDIVSACLRRLVIGMHRDEEKQFAREWLMTSQWTLENVQDCILLLTKCMYHSGVDRTGVGSLELQKTAAASANICNGGHSFRQSSFPHSHSELNRHAALPPESRRGGQQNLPRQTESHIQRVQPARAAKSQRVGKASEDERRQIGDAEATRQLNNANDEQGKIGENVLNMESALTTGVNPIVEATCVQQNAAIKKKSHRSRMEKELKSLMNTKLIEKSTNGPTKPQKRKALRQPDEDTQPPDRPGQDLHLPMDKRHVKTKRIPTLVARNVVKAPAVPETSDALRLPSMPIGPDNDHEREDTEIGVLDQRPSHEDSAKLPVLALSTSDFQE